MKSRKMFGWVLVIAGILLIVWTVYSSYNIFTGRNQVPSVFEIEHSEKVEKKELPKEEASEQDVQRIMEDVIDQQVGNMIPPEVLSKILNLIAWSIFAGILIFAGGKISMIGIKLVKE